MDFNGSDYDACGNSPPTASRHLSTTPPLQTGSLHSTPVSATSTAPSPLLTPDNAKPIRSCDFKNTIPSSRALGHLLDPHGRLSGDDTPNCHNLASPKGFGGYLSEEAKAVYHEQQLIWTETSKAFEPPGGNSAQKVKTVSEINKRKRDEPERERPFILLLILLRTSSEQENWLGINPTPVASGLNSRLRRSKHGVCRHWYQPRKSARMG